MGKKWIGVIIVILLFVLMVFAYVEVGKRTAQEGKAVIETSREALDGARRSANEMNERTNQTNKEVEKILGGEEKSE